MREIKEKTSFEKINERLEGLLEDTFPLKRFLIELVKSDLNYSREGILDIYQLIVEIKYLEKEAKNFIEIIKKTTLEDILKTI